MEPEIQQFIKMRSRQEKQEKIARFRYLNAYVRPGQILFAGSSLMEQFPIYEFLQDFQLPFTIYNRGVGGFTTQELLDNMEPCIYDLKPAHIFLNIGTNDLNVPDYDEDVLIEQYARILSAIQANLPAASLRLLAYYPVSTAVGNRIPGMAELLKHRTNERIRSANQRVSKLAEQFHAQFIDLNAPLLDEHGELKEIYTVEGMHMYANGYKPVLDQLIPILASLDSDHESGRQEQH